MLHPTEYALGTPCAPPAYVADPFVRAQGFGGNLWSDAIDVSSGLRGVDPQRYPRDMVPPPQWFAAQQPSYGAARPRVFEADERVFTENSRATEPAWVLRGRATERTPHFLAHDPTLLYRIPFVHDVDTRQSRYTW